MYCTTLHLQKRIVYRCFSLLLLISLVLHAFSLPQEWAVWDEALVPWMRRHWSHRRYRRHIVVGRLRFLKRRGWVLFCRLGLVAALLMWSGWWQHRPLCWALLSLPLADALLSLLPLFWPRVLKVRIYPYLVRGMRDLYLVTLMMLFSEGLLRPGENHRSLLVGGCVKMADGAWVRGEIEEDGTWRLEMEGHFILTWRPRNFFEERILLVLLRQLRTPQSTPKRPLLRQEWLAEWFGTHQVAQDNGFAEASSRALSRAVRRLLRRIFEFTADGPQWRDKVLLDRLFELNEVWLARLQAGEGLTPQLTLEVETLKEAVGAPITPLKKTLPLAYRLQRALFGQWEEIDDGSIRCPHCGSDLVSRKEKTPRCKRYRHPETREWRQVEGYRYYCLNPSCPFGTFTDYPEDVRLYSEWTVDTMLWAVMVYLHLRTTYRRAADVVAVSHVTLWRWAMAVGEQALPIATLFGVVRSSGVVGIDEKWVLVPKACGERSRTNDKPQGERQRWMYVYLAVDVFTYDLLHIDIYSYNGKAEAQAFLQALKAKSYTPQVIVTDMNQDYSEPIQAVFPGATHHECVFHALQWAQRLVKEVYGDNYAEIYPEAVTLKEQIYKVFDAKTRKTVNRRYRKVMALKEEYVAQRPEAQRLFAFLERHYPKLVNAVENPLIPLTNNTVELVIRRFDQHYQNMCGFDSIETARKYLHLFELTYRFTPFAQDNRPVKGREPDIRGKCPLELAGYDIGQLPIARILRGQLLGWPPETLQELVPNA